VKASILLLSLFLFGCAQQPIRIEVADISRSTNVVVKDLRPATEKEREQFSYSITSSAYGISRIGDTTLAPSAVRVLQHRAFEKFGGAGKPLDLSVHHFVIYANGKASMRAMALGGALGALMSSSSNSSGGFFGATTSPKTFDALLAEEHERAYTTDRESVGDSTVYVIYIDADINGKRTFTKTISPASYNEKKNALASAVDASINFFLAQNAK
jgi:hypothetical protein